MASNTVISLKSSFIRTQTRVLSQPLQPSTRWFDNSSDNDGLSTNDVSEVVREGMNHQMPSRLPFSHLQRPHVKRLLPTYGIKSPL